MTLPRRDATSLPADAVVELTAPSSAPQLTVLMPLFRQEDFVEEAVASVLSQSGVVCDVIVSDDDSGDGTLQRALDAIDRAEGTHSHGVRVRRGTQRLRRWHVNELITVAAHDIVVQAHGDDRALPGRMQALHDVMTEHNAVFVASLNRSIDAQGVEIGDHKNESVARGGGARRVSFAEAAARPEWAIGAVEAWRMSGFGAFPALEAGYAPMAHDRIMLMRAALLGRAVLIEKPLVERRLHGANWRDRLVDSSTTVRRKHGWAVSRVMIYDAIGHDIDKAVAGGACTRWAAMRARAIVRPMMSKALKELRSSHGALLADGQHAVWQYDEPDQPPEPAEASD